MIRRNTLTLSLFVLLILSAVLLLSSCGKGASEDGPEAAADSFLQGIKAGDSEAISRTYAGEDFDLEESFASVKALAGTVEGGEEAMDLLLTRLQDFDYKLSREKIEGDKATVKVRITTYDFGDAMTDFLTDYMIESSTLSLQGGSSEEMKTSAVRLFTETMEALKEKDYEEDTVLHMTKTDGSWKVDALSPDSEFLNVLSGGLAQSALELAEMIPR